MASGVPPTRPPINRSTRKLAISFTAAVGSWTAVNMARVTIYGVVRPMNGTSDTGERNNGPIPYPKTASLSAQASERPDRQRGLV